MDSYFHKVNGWFDTYFKPIVIVVGVAGGIATVIMLIMGLITFTKQKHYQAWSTLNTSVGISGNGGRSLALEELNNDGISLVYVNLKGAKIGFVRLDNAVLCGADLRNILADYARLRKAQLNDINADDSYLRWAHLHGACLKDASLAGANLFGAELQGAILKRAKLKGAELREARFDGADLTDADLSGCNLNGTSFRGANLTNVNLQGILGWNKIRDLTYANVRSVRNPPTGFLKWAKEEWKAVDDYAQPIEKWEQERSKQMGSGGL